MAATTYKPLSLTDLNSSDRFRLLNDASAVAGGRGELRALDEEGGAQQLRFPSDLADSDHWVCFRVAKNRKFRRKAVSQDDTLAYIYLPVPAQLQTGYKQNYAGESIGKAGAAALATGLVPGVDGQAAVFDKGAIAGAIGMDVAKNDLTQLLGTAIGGKIGGVSGGVIGNLVSQGAQNVVTALAGAAGIERNPHMAVLYKGVDFRSHSFSYKFVPRNEQESRTLDNIITAFKYYSAPNLSASTHFFDYPEQFDIDFKNERTLFDIGASVLTSFTVDYHGEGRPLYFDSPNYEKHPVSVNITMNFQELTITTKDEIKDYGR